MSMEHGQPDAFESAIGDAIDAYRLPVITLPSGLAADSPERLDELSRSDPAFYAGLHAVDKIRLGLHHNELEQRDRDER